jgi:hypothetical protein
MAAVDVWPNSNEIDSPAGDAFAITPHNTTELLATTRGIYIGGDGNITVLMGSGNVVLFTGLLAGTLLPIRVRRVNATGTTATDLVGLT